MGSVKLSECKIAAGRTEGRGLQGQQRGLGNQNAGEKLALKWAVPPRKPGVHMLASPRSWAPQQALSKGSSTTSAACCRACEAWP